MTKKYDFNTVIDRSGTDSYKYELMESYFGTRDALALWVADMDLPTPDFILEVIRKRCEHELLGYTIIGNDWNASIQRWLKKRHEWEISTDEIGFVPGIVSGIAFCLQCFTQPGDNVLIQTPVYPPFFNVPKKNDRRVVINPLVFENNQFCIDFEDFEHKASMCKAFILCSPHNPGGRVWTKDELNRMLEICKKHNVLVISDEIHADLTLPGFKHLPAATLNKTENLITLMAASKTFNIPGMCSSFFIINNIDLRNRFINFLDKSELSSGNLFAYLTPQAAYNQGEAWLDQLIHHLQNNVDYVDAFMRENIPAIKVCRPEASFLVWLDCRDLELDAKALQRFFIEDARLALNPGYSFGQGGEGFMRLNIGCPRSVLCEAMQRLKSACETLQS